MIRYLLVLLLLTSGSLLYGQDYQALLKSGSEKYSNEEYEAAISDFTKAIRAQPDRSEGYFGRGKCKIGIEY